MDERDRYRGYEAQIILLNRSVLFERCGWSPLKLVLNTRFSIMLGTAHESSEQMVVRRNGDG